MEGSYTPGRVAQPGSLLGLDRGLPVVCCTGRAQNRLVRGVATRIEQGGTMQRRVVIPPTVAMAPGGKIWPAAPASSP
jgi:hypothetical protein